MAKVKIQKKSKSSKKPKLVLKIKKPNIKFSKLNFKKMFSTKLAKALLIALGTVVVFVLVDLFVQYLNNGYSIAVVDGKRITMREFHNRLEASYGPTIAQQLIDEHLIRLEAKKGDIEVTDEEMDERLSDIIDSIGGEEAYQSALVASNITEEELLKQIELDILAKKIIEPTLEYTDEDVKAFFEQYSAMIYPTETEALEEGEKLDYELYKEDVKDVYIQQEVENSKYTWLEELKSTYKIQDNSTTKTSYGVLSATINIVKNLLNDANSNGTEDTTTE